MNHDDMYSVCTILYKTENTDGWYYATMSGSEEECEKECNKLKKLNNWYDYKCYVSSRYVMKQDIPFQNTLPEARYIHHLTDLIYNPYDNKFYYSSENIPYPNANKRTTNNFQITVKGEGEDDEYILIPDDLDDFECGTDITMSFGQNDKIITIADDLINDIPKFIKRLKSFGYSNLSIEEYTYAKFLAWKVKDKIRFIGQDYGDSDIGIVIDKLIPEKLFFSEFEKVCSKLEKYIEKHNKLYEEFKHQEKLLNSLKWEYDKDLPYVPWEYTIINWNKGKTKELEEFWNMIFSSENIENRIILEEEPYECFSCIKIGDYYYGVSEKDEGYSIMRTFFYTHKLKDIYYFMQSKDFEYKKGMSLTDIYNQLLEKGYKEVMECKYLGKRMRICANGQVRSNEATNDEIQKLEKFVTEIANSFNNKDNIKVFDVYERLRKYDVDLISHIDGKMKI